LFCRCRGDCAPLSRCCVAAATAIRLRCAALLRANCCCCLWHLPCYYGRYFSFLTLLVENLRGKQFIMTVPQKSELASPWHPSLCSADSCTSNHVLCGEEQCVVRFEVWIIDSCFVPELRSRFGNHHWMYCGALDQLGMEWFCGACFGI
jgi:hypothetical protein